MSIARHLFAFGRFVKAVASAFDQNVINGVQHFIECWDYMWTDEPSHIKFCSPSNQASKLAEEAGVPSGKIRIGQEPSGVNLFLHIAC